MNPIEELGLLKMDFLGLRNLDVIESAVNIIRRSRGSRIEIESIPLDDAQPSSCCPTATRGVFQLESEGMRDALKRIRPPAFDDLVALAPSIGRERCGSIPDYALWQARPRVGHATRTVG